VQTSGLSGLWPTCLHQSGKDKSSAAEDSAPVISPFRGGKPTRMCKPKFWRKPLIAHWNGSADYSSAIRYFPLKGRRLYSQVRRRECWLGSKLGLVSSLEDPCLKKSGADVVSAYVVWRNLPPQKHHASGNLKPLYLNLMWCFCGGTF